MRIPIKAAREIAKRYGLSQVVIWGKEDSASQHVTTYGRTIAQCSLAANFGNHLKRSLGWPEELCQTKPARVRARSRDKRMRLLPEERDIANSGRVILAIKMVRERLGIGLVEAKEMVDRR